MENDLVTVVSSPGAARRHSAREPCWWVALPADPESAAALLARVFGSAYTEILAQEILRRLSLDAETRSQETTASSGDTTP